MHTYADVAEVVLDKCISSNGYPDPGCRRYEENFNYEFLEDVREKEKNDTEGGHQNV